MFLCICLQPSLEFLVSVLFLNTNYSGVHLIRALIKRALAFCEVIFKSRPSSFYFPVKNPGYCELVIASFCLKRAYLFVPGVLNTQQFTCLIRAHSPNIVFPARKHRWAHYTLSDSHVQILNGHLGVSLLIVSSTLIGSF